MVIPHSDVSTKGCLIEAWFHTLQSNTHHIQSWFLSSASPYSPGSFCEPFTNATFENALHVEAADYSILTRRNRQMLGQGPLRMVEYNSVQESPVLETFQSHVSIR